MHREVKSLTALDLGLGADGAIKPPTLQASPPTGPMHARTGHLARLERRQKTRQGGEG